VSLATVADMEAVCGPLADQVAAQAALDQATTVLQAATGQQLVYVADDRVLLNGDGSRTLLLPQLPVTAVSSVKVTGTVLLAEEYQWDGDGLLRLDSCCGVFPDRLQGVDVTYSHGYEPVPDDLALACAAMACRLMAGGGPGGATADGVPITSERVGSYAVSYGQGLTFTEAAVVSRYRVPAL
jgi:hypothetical protein